MTGQVAQIVGQRRRRAKRHIGHAEEEAFGRREAAIMDRRFQAIEILACHLEIDALEIRVLAALSRCSIQP